MDNLLSELMEEYGADENDKEMENTTSDSAFSLPESSFALPPRSVPSATPNTPAGQNGSENPAGAPGSVPPASPVNSKATSPTVSPVATPAGTPGSSVSQSSPSLSTPVSTSSSDGGSSFAVPSTPVLPDGGFSPVRDTDTPGAVNSGGGSSRGVGGGFSLLVPNSSSTAPSAGSGDADTSGAAGNIAVSTGIRSDSSGGVEDSRVVNGDSAVEKKSAWTSLIPSDYLRKESTVPVQVSDVDTSVVSDPKESTAKDNDTEAGGSKGIPTFEVPGADNPQEGNAAGSAPSEGEIVPVQGTVKNEVEEYPGQGAVNNEVADEPVVVVLGTPGSGFAVRGNDDDADNGRSYSLTGEGSSPAGSGSSHSSDDNALLTALLSEYDDDEDSDEFSEADSASWEEDAADDGFAFADVEEAETENESNDEEADTFSDGSTEEVFSTSVEVDPQEAFVDPQEAFSEFLNTAGVVDRKDMVEKRLAVLRQERDFRSEEDASVYGLDDSTVEDYSSDLQRLADEAREESLNAANTVFEQEDDTEFRRRIVLIKEVDEFGDIMDGGSTRSEDEFDGKDESSGKGSSHDTGNDTGGDDADDSVSGTGGDGEVKPGSIGSGVTDINAVRKRAGRKKKDRQRIAELNTPTTTIVPGGGDRDYFVDRVSTGFTPAAQDKKKRISQNEMKFFANLGLRKKQAYEGAMDIQAVRGRLDRASTRDEKILERLIIDQSARKKSLQRGSVGRRVTEKDRETLEYLTKFKYATARHVSKMLACSEPAAAQRLQKLQQLGLVNSFTDTGSPQAIWVTTSAGVLFTGLDVPHTTRGKINFSGLQHQFVVNSTAAYLFNGSFDVLQLDGDFPEKNRTNTLGEKVFGETLISELQIKSRFGKVNGQQQATAYRPQLMRKIRRDFEEWEEAGGVSFGPSPEMLYGNEHYWTILPPSHLEVNYHYPDLVVARPRNEDGSPRSLAIEVERSNKEIERYERTLRVYRSDKLMYAQVIWVVNSVSVAKKLRRAAEKVGIWKEGRMRIISVHTPDGEFKGSDLFQL